MKRSVVLIIALAGTLVASAQQRRSLLDSDPDVVYLEEHLDRKVELRIIKAAPIYSDKEGKRQLGAVNPGQVVELQAMTERAYRVSAKAGNNKMIGWVAPWAFASKDPNFVENLAKLYKRQLEVAKLIEDGRAAIGMTLDEVGKALGSPTKKTLRQTDKGRSGKWEFIDYETIQHYNYVRDPLSGQVYKQLSHVTKEEKGKTVIEFEDEVVTAIEESETREGSARVKIVVPPVVFAW